MSAAPRASRQSTGHRGGGHRGGGRRKGRGPDRRSAARFAVFAVLTVVLTFFIGQQILGTGFTDRYELTATFDDVTGLLGGDLVKVAGAPVGRVGDIEVRDGRAVVVMRVDRGVRLPGDSTASVRWRNMLGQRMIYLEPGQSAATLPDGGRVRHTRSVVDLSEIVNSLGPLTRSLDPDQLNKVLNAFAQTLDGNSGNVNMMIRNLDVLLQTFNSRRQTIDGMIKNYKTVTEAIATRDRQIAAGVDNLRRLTEVFARNRELLESAVVEVSGVSADLNQVLGGDDVQLGRIIENLARFAETARLNIDQLEALVQKLPLTLRQLFAAGNGGNFLRTNALCLNIVQGPCPFPMRLPDGGGDPGGRTGEPSPQDLARLGSMLRGGR